MSVLRYATALTVAAAAPHEGLYRTVAEVNDMGDTIGVCWVPRETQYAQVRDALESRADARHGARILGTEVFTRGRWRVVQVGDECPR
jgi:ribosomal silencing factor RsfS